MAPENFRGHFFAIIKCVELAGIGLFNNIRGVRKNYKSQITNQMPHFAAIRG
jgi:hypothetical protein